MTRFTPKFPKGPLLFCIVFSLALNGCQRSNSLEPRNSMKNSISRIQSIFNTKRTICFGRFLIEIPETSTVVYGPAEAETPINFYQGQANNISHHLASRLAEVENEKKYLMNDDVRRLPLLGKVIEGAVPGQKIVFGSKNPVGYTIHSFIPLGEDLFIQHLDRVLPEDDEVSTINRVASHLKSRSQNEIPAEAGSCIEGGLITLDQEYEGVTLGIRLQNFPDVHLSIDVHKNQDYLPEGNNPKLLREQAKASANENGLGAVFASTKILREQVRQLGNWTGEEIALRTPAYKDAKSVHEFRFYSKGAVHDSLRPELDIRFDSGVKDNQKASIDPSITDEEALELWDKLISTIRIRKPSDATPTTPAKVPLASQSTSGEICPQTGWWEPAGHKEWQNAKRRFVKSGEPMPPLQLDIAPSFWQKLAGQQSTRQIATTWTLVEYSDEPASPSTAS